VLNVPGNDASGEHEVPFCSSFYIERADFKEKDEEGYFGLALDKPKWLKLRYTNLSIKLVDLKKDSNGVITREELCFVMRSLGQNPTETELNELIRQVDKDNDNTISQKEFLDMMANYQNPEQKEELEAAFKFFTKPSDKFAANEGKGITKDALKAVVQLLGESLTDEEIEEMILEANLDKNTTPIVSEANLDNKNNSTPFVNFKDFCLILQHQS